MIDCVYILGSGSKHLDIEFFYSLKGVKKFLRNVRRVHVIGDSPQCACYGSPAIPFNHVPHPDRHPDKQKNARDKLKRACETADITERFLLMNDDFYFTQEVDAESVPYYREGTLGDQIEWRRSNKSNYYKALCATEEVLKELGKPTLNFEIHVPIIYEKSILGPMLQRGDCWHRRPVPLVRSLYANLCGHPGVYRADCKIEGPFDIPEIRRRTEGFDSFSVGDGAFKGEIAQFLGALYS